MRAKIGPKPLAVHFHHHECGNGENCTGNQSLADRGRSAGDVLFQDAAAKCGNAEERHGDDGRWNSSGDGLTGAHSEIGVGRAENKSQENSETDRFDGHLGRGLLRAVLH